MRDQINALNAILMQVQVNVPYVLLVIGFLAFVHLVNVSLGYRLNVFGIYPRKPFGLVGIICAPFLHANFNHLFFNAIPLFILMNLVLLDGYKTFMIATIGIFILAGGITWLVGRPAQHVGASSIIFGYWGYLLANAWQKGTVFAIVLGLVCIYYFGGFILSVIPGKKSVSWEGHLFGALGGFAMATCMTSLCSL